MGHVTELDTCKLCVHINIEQDGRYTYNVTLGPFSKTTVATERQQCVTSVLLSYTCQKCNNNDCRTTMLLWQNNVSTVGKERQQCVTSVLLSYTSVKNVTVMSVAQQCFYGKLMLPATIRRT